MMAVQAGAKPEMMNESDSDDDKPIVFKRNNTASKQNQLNPEVKNSSSQKLDGKSGRQMSDVRSPNGQNSSVQKGKIVPSTKGSPVISPLASPKASISSVKASVVKSPVANTKALTSVSDQSKNCSQQNKSTIVKKEKPLGRPHVDPCSDSEDDTPLSHRLSAGASNGSSHHVSKGSSNSVPASSAFSKPSVKEEDSEDEKPLSLKFQLKSNAGASASNCYDSDENKPLASKLKQNGSGVRDNQLKKSSTALNKRPSAEAKYSVQSSVKKAKLSNASISINCKQVSVKAEPSGKDAADDHVPISQRIKTSATPVSKLSDKKKTTTMVSSSVKKINNKSKKVIKKTKFSKSSKVPPGSGEGQKWTTLVHNGVIFPPPYKPHGVKMNYKGQPVNLTPEQEEVATMIAVMRDTEYWTKPMFIENFMSDWKKILGKNHIIQNFKDCDFDPIYEWHQREKEKKKQMSTEEKKTLKEEKMKQEEKYMWAIVDGVKEKVGNFRVEPPGLFRGRGEHPKMGKLKKRIRPSDITINIGKDAPIPECPIPGQSWKEIRHDNTVTWLAFWNDPINPKEFKYVFLAASSSLKGQSDKEKYEKSRKLKGYIEGIRAAYTKNFSSKDVTKRQAAVATYLIDKLALRAGNEKDDDEADTVGCCTLKKENVIPVPPNILKFDFLGKDSIRYLNEVEVELPVFKAIQQFGKGKKDSDDLFDQLDTSKLNAHLKELMPGLTAKVFRTYNASITLDEMLSRETRGGDVAEKVVVYQHANKEVAIICNHQRSVSKSHSAQISRLEEKIDELKGVLEELKKDLTRAKKGKPLLKNAASALPLSSDFVSPSSSRSAMALELWETLKESITVYTGLSPATFFTVLALGIAVYYVVSGIFGSSSQPQYQSSRDYEEDLQPLPPPVQLGEISEEELKAYDGADPKKPLLMAIKGQIYDVSQSRMFYGPGGPYALFAGKDASRALAKMSFEDKDLNGDLSGLGVFELEALQDWEYKFMSKYVKVGTIKRTVPVTDDSTTSETAEATDRNAKPVEDAPSESAAIEPKETTTGGEADKE